MIKVVFFGSGYFGLSILKSLLKLSEKKVLEISAIVSQPSKTFGRRKVIFDNLVTQFCKESGYSNLLLTPNRLLDVKNLLVGFDLGVVASYGKIIPTWLINSFKFGLINFHASLLPKYRGAIPIQSILLNQDYEALGVSVIKINEDLDSGDIIFDAKFNISFERFLNLTSLELTQEVANFASSLLLDNYELIIYPKNWSTKRQDCSQATYCYLSDLSKEKFEISFFDNCLKAHGKIMAGNPDPKAYVVIDGKLFNLLRSKVHYICKPNFINLQNIAFFSLKDKLFINLLDENKILEILEIQPEGRKILDSKNFINGYKKFITVY